MQHGVRQTGGRLSAATNQLNTLTYGNATWGMQVEHLEGRDAKRHANTRCDFFGLIEKLVKQFVQNALRRGNTQRQASRKRGIALVNGLGRSTGREHVTRIHAATVGSISTSSASLRAGESLLMTKHPTSDRHPAGRQPMQKQPWHACRRA